MIPIKELLSTPLFAHIEPSEFNRYIHPDDYVEHTYAAHTLIAHEGDACHHLAYIAEGSLIAHQLASDGKQLTVNTFGSHDFFAAALLPIPDASYPFNISTVTASRVFYIHYKAIETFLDHNPTFSSNYRHLLSEKIMMFKEKVELLQHRDVRSRLLTYLHDESLYHNSSTFKLRHTKVAIAESIGVARPSVSRELKHMEDDGLLRMNGKWIELSNLISPQ